jgi:hypothetical protein
MLKHVNDNGDLNTFVNNEGDALIRCSACSRTWYVQFTPATRNPAEGTTQRQFQSTIQKNSLFAKRVGIDVGRDVARKVR